MSDMFNRTKQALGGVHSDPSMDPQGEAAELISRLEALGVKVSQVPRVEWVRLDLTRIPMGCFPPDTKLGLSAVCTDGRKNLKYDSGAGPVESVQWTCTLKNPHQFRPEDPELFVRTGHSREVVLTVRATVAADALI
jgi:hypothetical protein